MDRRTFTGRVTVGLIACPLAACAQQSGKVPVVGVLHPDPGPRASIPDKARQALRDLGYVDGRNIAFEARFAGGKPQTFPDLAADLVRRKVDVLLTIGPAALRAASDATTTIPIVAYDLEADPVQAGYVRNLAQPGGNITGFFLDQPGLASKWLELIKEVVPGSRRIAVLVDTTTGPWQLASIKRAAEKLGIELQPLEIRNAAELDQVLGDGVKGGSLALVQLSSPLFNSNAEQIAAFTMRNGLPAISMFGRFAETGGLMSYGPDEVAYSDRPAVYIDKILKGAKPGDLPIEQPTRFRFVINLKTAKALGLAIPESILVRGEVIR